MITYPPLVYLFAVALSWALTIIAVGTLSSSDFLFINIYVLFFYIYILIFYIYLKGPVT